MPGRDAVGAVDDVDGVLHPSGASDVLALDPRGPHAFFQLPALIDHHDRVLAAQAPGHEARHYGHRRLVVPRRALQQPLHPVRRADPASWASVQQFFGDEPLIKPAMYLRACRRGSTRAKQQASTAISSSRFSPAWPAPTIAAAAASRS